VKANKLYPSGPSAKCDKQHSRNHLPRISHVSRNLDLARLHRKTLFGVFAGLPTKTSLAHASSAKQSTPLAGHEYQPQSSVAVWTRPGFVEGEDINWNEY
jgi:hypothetical protein